MRSHRQQVFAALLIAVGLAAPRPGLAQIACSAAECDMVVDADTLLEGAGIGAGTTICVRATAAEQSWTVRDLHGRAEAPIRVVPCDGVVRVGGDGAHAALRIVDSEHLVVSGGESRALRLDGGDRRNTVGIDIAGCSAAIELDHLEIQGTSYTGIRSASTSDDCLVRSGFSIHHLHIHDVGGEGMFLGLNNGSSPHLLTDVEVYANLIERTGFQGIKMGTTLQDAFVHDNVVIEAGTADRSGEDTGITGSARVYRIERNVVLRSNASCVFASGTHLSIVNNVLIGCGDRGITVNGTLETLRVVHNTFVAVGGDGVTVWASVGAGIFVDNLFVDHPAGRGTGPTASATWVALGNLETTTAEGGFLRTVDPATATAEMLSPPPYDLSATSVARDAGSGAAREHVPQDCVERLRDEQPDVGAHEYQLPAPDAGTPDAGGPTDLPDSGVIPERDASSGGVIDGGRVPADGGEGAAMGGCSITGAASANAALWAGFLLTLGLARRMRRRR